MVDFRHLQEVLVILETKEYAAPSQEGDSTQAVTGGETESGTPQSESSSETETQQTQQAQ